MCRISGYAIAFEINNSIIISFEFCLLKYFIVKKTRVQLQIFLKILEERILLLFVERHLQEIQVARFHFVFSEDALRV